LTANGKVDRQALPRPAHESAARESAKALPGAARPLTGTEQTLVAIWKELLQVEDVALTDDFFDLGGHSLLAIKVVSRIRDVFGLELQTRTLFENPTIGDLSGILTATQESPGGASHIERRQEAGPCALSFAQERMWFLSQLAPRSPAYNIVDVIPVLGLYD